MTPARRRRRPRGAPDGAPAPADTVTPLRAVDGRVPGRRGQATRRKLLDCTRNLLTSTSYRDVKVVDIAREAGTSPATFYQYFADVEAAILVLGEEVARAAGHLTELVGGDWDGDGDRGEARAREVVEAFMEFWEEHRAVLRVVELATEEGDRRFQNTRVRALNAVTEALAEVITASQRDGRVPEDADPIATAGTLVAMLAQVSAHRYGFEFWGIRTQAVQDSLTRILRLAVTGSPD